MPVTPVKEPETAVSRKPVKVISLRGLSASIFANKAKSADGEFTFHKVSFERKYKDGDKWQYTTSFGRNDLPVLKSVVERAWEYILDAESSRGTEDADE